MRYITPPIMKYTLSRKTLGLGLIALSTLSLQAHASDRETCDISSKDTIASDRGCLDMGTAPKDTVSGRVAATIGAGRDVKGGRKAHVAGGKTAQFALTDSSDEDANADDASAPVADAVEQTAASTLPILAAPTVEAAALAIGADSDSSGEPTKWDDAYITAHKYYPKSLLTIIPTDDFKDNVGKVKGLVKNFKMPELVYLRAIVAKEGTSTKLVGVQVEVRNEDGSSKKDSYPITRLTEEKDGKIQAKKDEIEFGSGGIMKGRMLNPVDLTSKVSIVLNVLSKKGLGFLGGDKHTKIRLDLVNDATLKKWIVLGQKEGGAGGQIESLELSGNPLPTGGGAHISGKGRTIGTTPAARRTIEFSEDDLKD